MERAREKKRSSPPLCCHSGWATEAFDVLQISNFIIDNPPPTPLLLHSATPPCLPLTHSLFALALKQAFLPPSLTPTKTSPSVLKLRKGKPCRGDSSLGLIINWTGPVHVRCIFVYVSMYMCDPRAGGEVESEFFW